LREGLDVAYSIMAELEQDDEDPEQPDPVLATTRTESTPGVPDRVSSQRGSGENYELLSADSADRVARERRHAREKAMATESSRLAEGKHRNRILAEEAASLVARERVALSKEEAARREREVSNTFIAMHHIAASHRYSYLPPPPSPLTHPPTHSLSILHTSIVHPSSRR